VGEAGEDTLSEGNGNLEDGVVGLPGRLERTESTTDEKLIWLREGDLEYPTNSENRGDSGGLSICIASGSPEYHIRL